VVEVRFKGRFLRTELITCGLAAYSASLCLFLSSTFEISGMRANLTLAFDETLSPADIGLGDDAYTYEEPMATTEPPSWVGIAIGVALLLLFLVAVLRVYIQQQEVQQKERERALMLVQRRPRPACTAVVISVNPITSTTPV
jgi:hypothetical protein